MRRLLQRLGPGLLVLGLMAPGCSIRQMAVNQVGNALAGGGATFARDDDPELVRAAIPFSLKLLESLLAESPRHRGLLLAASSGFTQYAYAFVQQEADELEDKDLAAATALRQRARRLYLRARDYGLRGLEAAHRGFPERLRADPLGAVRCLRKAEVPTVYWTAASWGAAIALSKDEPQLIAEIPMMEALMDRALELNEAFDHGSIHGFLITYEMARQGRAGEPADRARQHFERAMALGEGRLASPLVAFAEAVCVQKQDWKQFRALLEKAVALDADPWPDSRLVNLILQRRARWLLSQQEDLFLIPAEEAPAATRKPQ